MADDVSAQLNPSMRRLRSLMSDIGSKTSVIKNPEFDEQFMHKLVRAAEGLDTLSADDANVIVSVLRKDEEAIAESRIVDLIVGRLKDSKDIMDEGFLRYLSENYNKLVTIPGTESDTMSSPVKECGSEDAEESIERQRASTRAMLYLRDIYNWDFDAFAMQTAVPSPMVAITQHCLHEYNLIDCLDFNADKLTNFLQAIHDGYNALPYHNALHAADVTQSTFYLLSTGKVIEAISANQIAVASVLIAAAIHDVGHPGLNGKFLITTNSPIAIEYSDKSPLEMMHLATAFRLWREDANNFTDRIPLSHYREMRRLIVEMVLLTDNDMHFTLLNRLDRSITVYSSHDVADVRISDVDLPPPPQSGGCRPRVSLSGRSPSTHLTTDDRQLLLLQVTLHTADVSNTAKPWNLYSKWLERITEEFYLQGDMERSLNMPISYAFDRFNPVTQSKFQLGFIKAIVGPLYKTFSKVDGVDISECLEHLKNNSRRWKDMVADEDGPV